MLCGLDFIRVNGVVRLDLYVLFALGEMYCSVLLAKALLWSL